MLVKTRNPPPSGRMTEQQRVTSTDSCGASPGKSALDRSARRDPGGAIKNLTSDSMAGFAVTTEEAIFKQVRGAGNGQMVFRNIVHSIALPPA